jgi:hypothetical protein
MGRRTYASADLSEQDAADLGSFYTRHRDRVIGIGRRIGTFWVADDALTAG